MLHWHQALLTDVDKEVAIWYSHPPEQWEAVKVCMIGQLQARLATADASGAETIHEIVSSLNSAPPLEKWAHFGQRAILAILPCEASGAECLTLLPQRYGPTLLTAWGLANLPVSNIESVARLLHTLRHMN